MKSEIIDKITTGIEGILEDKGNTNIDTRERIASVLAGTSCWLSFGRSVSSAALSPAGLSTPWLSSPLSQSFSA